MCDNTKQINESSQILNKETKMNKVQTVKKMSLVPIIAAIVSSLTYKYIKDSGVSAEIYTAVLISVGIGIKDILKYQFKLF